MMKRGFTLLIILICLANVAESASFQEEGGGEEADFGFNHYFQDFFNYESMMDAINNLSAIHPDIMRIYDLTESIDPNNRMGIPMSTWQGRAMWLIKVSDGVESEPAYYSDPEEPDILIIGAHHGNEWMSFEVVMYYLFYLVETYGMPPTDNDGDGKINEDILDGADNDGDGMYDEDPNEGRVTWLVDNREIWIIPMFNPDGVSENTRTNGRRETPIGIGRIMVPTNGVDVNRNYPFMWAAIPDPETGKSMDSSIPTSSIYRGPDDNYDQDGDSILGSEQGSILRDKIDPNKIDEDQFDNMDNDNDGLIDEDRDGGFSEPETVALWNLVKSLDGNRDDKTDFVTSISYHCYGAMILYPWGYTIDESQHEGLFSYLAEDMARFNGYDPMVGTDLYPVGGELDDWLYGKHDVIPFTFELDAGSHRGEAEDIINISIKNLGPNIYVAENAPQIEVAHARFGSSLDIGLPVINHTQKIDSINSDATYTVKVEISNTQKLKDGSVLLYYKSGEDGDWKSKGMKTNDDQVYKATIPQQRGGKNVYYYIEAKAVYIEAESVDGAITVLSPTYGQYEAHSYFVDLSLGDTFGDLAAMILMMALIFGLIYTGLFKSLKLAIDAEKRKNMS
jgi:hypothetical protein